MHTSDNVRLLEPSATMAVSARARELRAAGHDVIDLSAGEPDFGTPHFIAEAGIDAIRNGQTYYAPPAGLPALREAIAAELARQSGRDISPASVVVTVGAKQALFNACFVLFGPGDRVLVPAPYWTSYPALVHLARAEPVAVHADPERGFKVTVRELDRAAEGGVRGLILNSPSNPTGAVYTPDELEAIASWAAERDVWLISDEIYARICYVGERAPGLLDLDPALGRRAVVVNGASKIFAMTGWRIGYSHSDPELARRMAALQSQITSCASTPAQFAATAAYRAGPAELDTVQQMIDTFRRRRERVVALFDKRLPGVSYVRPDGAFYVFFRADPWAQAGDASAAGSVEVCTRLLEETGVALVPGAAFGDDRFIRLSFAASEEVLVEGIHRLASARVGSVLS